MFTLSHAFSALLADFVLVLHACVVAFAVFGQLLFVLGGLRHWDWVRLAWVRLSHLALIAFVLLQSFTGMTCPLTVWEQMLRYHSAQVIYAESFVGHWLAKLIFFNASQGVFTTVYTVFGAMVLLTWWWIPPRWRSLSAGDKKG